MRPHQSMPSASPATTPQDVRNVRRAYAALDAVFRTGDAEAFRPILEELWDTDVVYEPADVVPETAPIHGRDGIVRLIADQMTVFRPGTLWLEPLEYVEAGELLVVPYRFGGRARYSGIELRFFFVHVITLRCGRVTRVEVFESRARALRAAGIPEDR